MEIIVFVLFTTFSEDLHEDNLLGLVILVLTKTLIDLWDSVPFAFHRSSILT